jgi:hypothetical protein
MSNSKGGRPPGYPKTGGRQKGTRNKASLEVRELLAELEFDPIMDLVKISRKAETSDEMRFSIDRVIAQYRYPKLKPADNLNEAVEDFQVTTILDATDELRNKDEDDDEPQRK